MADTSSSDKPTKAFSCVRCFERKVKCDKQHPCSGCVKSNVECVFRVPSAPRRKKKRLPEDALLARLKRAEGLLQSKGVDVEEELGPTPQQPLPETKTSAAGGDRAPLLHSQPHNSGRLIVSNQGKSRFIENNLWNTVSEEFQQPNEAMDDTSSEEEDEDEPAAENSEFLLGLTPGSTVQHLHPSPENMFKLWQAFLEGVHPMTKIIHAPSTQDALVKAATNLDSVGRGLECLMFAIYCAAVTSLEEIDCEAMFSESKRTLVSRYRQGARRALARAKFLGTADVMVLQAFAIYLLVLRDYYDSRTLWTLAGVATRMAQGMGIHRDGTTLGLPPFETELRRRLWWQITMLDFRSAELTGSGQFSNLNISDTKVPSNVNDADIWPGMTAFPTPATKPTEMITCLLRCEFGSFWKGKLAKEGMAKQLDSATRNGEVFHPWDSPLEVRDRHITELEHILEEKFLRYCDISIPVQFMASVIGRGAISSMKLMAHHPRRYANEADIPPEERALLWRLSVKLLENDNLAHTSKGLRRFMWHTNVYFQWQALVYLLGELKKHTVGEDVDAAWREVGEVFANHPDFIADSKKPLHLAIGNLCLKAYDARRQGLEKQQREQNLPFTIPIQTPSYIDQLRLQRQLLKQRSESKATHSATAEAVTRIMSGEGGNMGMDALPMSGMSISPNQQPPQQQQQPQATYGTAQDQTPLTWASNPSSTASGFAPPMQTQQQFSYQYPLFDPTSPAPAPMPFDTNMMFVVGGNEPDVQMDWLQWDTLIQDFEMGK